ncbi:hypothetical protein BBBOND_0105280 [Babesia bigemina]|uniref:Uncharacterized protein n=1 Tax=Babesia bigemina TaxID=5866 RepID=A0A061D5H6_BABBI|nr:hypothetical protein BBBOND_0105280 [Babesia bigemina]CDR94219.1 hypothetical protein BBBOND_0105280 [Babesia bigemina]|eukprot:XP_012766405.1 hypothetical protein BBBOND_0105280 [Babesia bigemina]
MIIFMLLLCQATLGLYIGRPLSNINFGSIRKDVPSHFFHSHLGNAKDVPIFVVESITSPVITRITRSEKIVTAFVDPRDAIDYLTELTQAGSAVEYELPSLRIRILTLQELFEKIDPTKPRISSHIKYKLVPSSSQLPLASLYLPLSYKNDVHIPLFYSKALNISPTEGKVLTPLFWDFADLTASINMISDLQHREALIKSIGILSLFDILLENPRLDGYYMVPSLQALQFCQKEKNKTLFTF